MSTKQRGQSQTAEKAALAAEKGATAIVEAYDRAVFDRLHREGWRPLAMRSWDRTDGAGVVYWLWR